MHFFASAESNNLFLFAVCMRAKRSPDARIRVFLRQHREAIKHLSDGVPVYSTPRSGATRGPSGALIVQWRRVRAASARCRATPARCEHRRSRANIGVASSLVTFFWRRRRKLLPPRHERDRGIRTHSAKNELGWYQFEVRWDRTLRDEGSRTRFASPGYGVRHPALSRRQPVPPEAFGLIPLRRTCR